MKKPNTKKHQPNKTKKVEKQRRRHKKWLKGKRRHKTLLIQQTAQALKKQYHEARKSKEPVKVKAPSKFSLIEYPESVLEFFQRIKNYTRRKIDVIIDLEHIEYVTPDTIILLIANINNHSFRNGVNLYGIKPAKTELDDIFRESGFYKMIGIDKTMSDHGIIKTKRSTIVDREIAVEARVLTAKKTFNNPNKMLHPLYRTLIECMANTKKHAKGQSTKEETWWLAVFNNKETKATSFSFIDTGVGIFKSTKVQKLTKFAVKLGLYSNINILRDLLEGKIQSSTGLKYRGKGLPKIYSDFRENHLNKLHIISNDVYANLTDGTFIELDHPLNGTFFYWEIQPDQLN